MNHLKIELKFTTSEYMTRDVSLFLTTSILLSTSPMGGSPGELSEELVA